jgi:hypothetical protein
MNFLHPTDHNNGPMKSSLGELLGEAIALYARAPILFILVSLLPAVLINIIGQVVIPNTDNLYLASFRATVINTIIIGFHTSTFYLVVLASRQRKLQISSSVSAVVAFGPKLFLLALITSAAALLLIPTIFGIFIAIYVGVRLSLIRPFIVLENTMPLQAVLESWKLIEGNWVRTFTVQFIVISFSVIVFVSFSILMRSIGENMWVTLLLQSLAQSLVAPLSASVEITLFDEYKKH